MGRVDGGVDEHITTDRTLSGTWYAKTVNAHLQQCSGPPSLFCGTQIVHFLHIQSKSDTIETFPPKVLLLFLPVDFLLFIWTGGLHVHDCASNFFQTCDMWKLKPCDDPTSCTCFNPLTAAMCVVCLHYR